MQVAQYLAYFCISITKLGTVTKLQKYGATYTNKGIYTNIKYFLYKIIILILV